MRTRFLVLVAIVAILLFVLPAAAQETVDTFPAFNSEALCGPEDNFSFAVPSPSGLALATVHWDNEYYQSDQSHSGYHYNSGQRDGYNGILLLDRLTGALAEIPGKDVWAVRPIRF